MRANKIAIDFNAKIKHLAYKACRSGGLRVYVYNTQEISLVRVFCLSPSSNSAQLSESRNFGANKVT